MSWVAQLPDHPNHSDQPDHKDQPDQQNHFDRFDHPTDLTTNTFTPTTLTTLQEQKIANMLSGRKTYKKSCLEQQFTKSTKNESEWLLTKNVQQTSKKVVWNMFNNLQNQQKIDSEWLVAKKKLSKIHQELLVLVFPILFWPSWQSPAWGFCMKISLIPIKGKISLIFLLPIKSALFNFSWMLY